MVFRRNKLLKATLAVKFDFVNGLALVFDASPYYWAVERAVRGGSFTVSPIGFVQKISARRKKNTKTTGANQKLGTV